MIPPQNGPLQVEGLGDGLTSGDGDAEGVALGVVLGVTLGSTVGEDEGDTVGDGSTVGDADGVVDGVTEGIDDGLDEGDGVAVAVALGVGVGAATIGQNGTGSKVKPLPESVMLFQARTEPWILPLPEICAVPRGAIKVPWTFPFPERLTFAPEVGTRKSTFAAGRFPETTMLLLPERDTFPPILIRKRSLALPSRVRV